MLLCRRERVCIFKSSGFFRQCIFELFGPLSGEGIDPIGRRFLDSLAFTKLILFKDAVAGYGGEAVKFAVTKDGDHIFILNNGSKIIFGADQDFDTLTGNLDAVSATLPQNAPIEYIDLRYGNKVFFKEKKNDEHHAEGVRACVDARLRVAVYNVNMYLRLIVWEYIVWHSRRPLPTL